MLCPSEESEFFPSIFLRGQIEKITGTQPGVSLKGQLDQATRRTVQHAPTIAYHIKDAVLVDGCIYAQRMKFVVGDKSVAEDNRFKQLGAAAICSSAVGNTYFGHWLTDDVLTYMLAERYSKPICYSPIFPKMHKSIYERLFQQDWTPTDRAHIEHLILFKDFAQTSLKKRRQIELRGKVLERFAPSNSRNLIYLKRGNTGTQRSIANEPEIIEDLSKRGFVILDVETDSLDRILSHLVSAKMVISIEGSQTCHGAYSLPKDSGLLLLQPPGRFLVSQRGWSENIGVRFGFVVGDPKENSTYFSVLDILKTVDLFFKE